MTRRLWIMVLFHSSCAATILLPIAGCGGSDRARVTGAVVRHDGTPLAGARVIARSDDATQTAYGQTDAEGRFELGTAQAGDGVPPGDYTMIILEDPGDRDQRRPPTIAAKYGDHSRSGLRLSVAQGERKVFDVQLDPS